MLHISKKIIFTWLFIFVLANFQIILSQVSEENKNSPKVEVVSRDNDFVKEGIIGDKKEVKKNTTEDFEKLIKELSTRIKSLENVRRGDYDDEQKRLLLSLDILTKTEQRAENLRKQLIELIEKETSIKTRLEVIEYNLRPEIISRSTAIYGSLRPEDIRDQKKKNLESEKKNYESLLKQVQSNRIRLEQSLKKADEWVEKVRNKFEKQIDKALQEKEEN